MYCFKRWAWHFKNDFKLENSNNSYIQSQGLKFCFINHYSKFTDPTGIFCHSHVWVSSTVGFHCQWACVLLVWQPNVLYLPTSRWHIPHSSAHQKDVFQTAVMSYLFDYHKQVSDWLIFSLGGDRKGRGGWLPGGCRCWLITCQSTVPGGKVKHLRHLKAIGLSDKELLSVWYVH